MSHVEMRGGGPLPPNRAMRIVLDEGRKAMKKAVVHTEGTWRSQLVPTSSINANTGLNARGMAAGGYRTGTYSRSITHSVSPPGEIPITGKVGTNIFYAKYLEYGTGLYGPSRHWITPKNGNKFMRFPGAVGAGTGFTLAGRRRSGRAGAQARWIYAKRIRGIKPRRYAEKAATRARPSVSLFFYDAAHNAADRIRKETDRQ